MDLFLQCIFAAGAFLQSFLLLRNRGLGKRLRILFIVWVLTVGWLMLMVHIGGGGGRTPRFLVFGVLFWAMMTGISCFREWAPRPDRFSLIIHALAFLYLVSVRNGIIIFLFAAVSLIFFGVFFREQRDPMPRRLHGILVFLYFAGVFVLAIIAGEFGEMYLMIDPGIPIRYPWYRLLAGGMFFQYAAMHGAVLFWTWSSLWAGGFRRKESAKADLAPDFRGQYSRQPLRGLRLVLLLAAALLYTVNLSTGALPHSVVLLAGFVLLPDLQALFS